MRSVYRHRHRVHRCRYRPLQGDIYNLVTELLRLCQFVLVVEFKREDDVEIAVPDVSEDRWNEA